MIDLKLIESTSIIIRKSITEMYKKDKFVNYNNVMSIFNNAFLYDVRDFLRNKQYYYTKIKEFGVIDSVLTNSFGILYLRVVFNGDNYCTYRFKDIDSEDII